MAKQENPMYRSQTLRCPRAILLCAAMAMTQGFAQQTPQPQAGGRGAPTPEMLQRQKLSTEDRQKMLDALHISSLRPPVEARDLHAAHPANYDESKANPYPNLPDPLVMKNGKKVTSAKMWWNQRRPEIVEDFDREIYGRVPKVTPKVKWEVVKTAEDKNGDVEVVTKQ